MSTTLMITFTEFRAPGKEDFTCGYTAGTDKGVLYSRTARSWDAFRQGNPDLESVLTDVLEDVICDGLDLHEEYEVVNGMPVSRGLTSLLFSNYEYVYPDIASA